MVSQRADGFGGSITFQDFTSGDTVEVTVGETLTIPFKAIIEDPDFKEDNTDVSTTVFLYRNGEPDNLTNGGVSDRDKQILIDDATSFQATERDIITGSVTTNQYETSFETSGRSGFDTFSVDVPFDANSETRTETLYLRMVSEYEFTGDVTDATTGELNINVTPRDTQQELQLQNGEAEAIRGEQRIQSAFEEHTDFALTDLTFEDGFTPNFEDAEGSENPQLKLDERYNRPRVAIDTAARFVDHEIIGGKKVRQRVGSDPIELSVNGVCQRPRANEIDQLHRVKTAQLQSERLPQDKTRLPVQIASTTTEPLEDGGAADARTGELLYTFTINAVEVIEE